MIKRIYDSDIEHDREKLKQLKQRFRDYSGVNRSNRRLYLEEDRLDTAGMSKKDARYVDRHKPFARD